MKQDVATLPLRVVADITQWNIRAIRSDTEELQLGKQYKPQIVVCRNASYVKIKL